MPRAYLTIDDSPSAQTDELTDFLRAKAVPALLFCRGDRLAANPDPAIRAVEKGFVLGNHAWSHTRFSTLSFEEGVAEIERTEEAIEEIYRAADTARPGKYFRFPHMDRGCGGYVIDYDAVPAEHRQTLVDLFAGGLNIELKAPSSAMRDKKERLQGWLREAGFTPPPFAGITLPWYAHSELAQAVDAMFTFSTADWMVGPRHAGKWPCKSIDDLKKKIDDDPGLKQGGAHVILAHDQDGLFPVVRALVDHLLEKGFNFETF